MRRRSSLTHTYLEDLLFDDLLIQARLSAAEGSRAAYGPIRCKDDGENPLQLVTLPEINLHRQAGFQPGDRR